MNFQQLRADYIIGRFVNFYFNLNLASGLHFISVFFLSSLIVLLIGIVFIVVRSFLLIKRLGHEKPVFLELTPPSKTEQDSVTTEKFFSLVHALTNKRTFVDRVLGYKIRISLEIVSTQIH